MKLTVFGVSGRLGGEVVRQAVAAGHDVTAVVRDTSSFSHPEVRVMTASFHDEHELDAALAGRDAVLSGVGPRHRRDAGAATDVTKAIVAGMRDVGVRRIVVVSAAPVDPPSPEDNFVWRSIASPLLRRLFADVYGDLRAMEQVLRDSGLAWTSVRPPKLTNGPLTGTYRSRIGGTLPRGSVISRADVADAMLRAAGDDAQIDQVVGVAR
jgi:uncharacterized protein YbjT (DUF2867 family)